MEKDKQNSKESIRHSTPDPILVFPNKQTSRELSYINQIWLLILLLILYSLPYWLDNHQHRFNSFINIFGRGVFKSVFDSYRKLFECFIICIFFESLSTYFTFDIKGFSIGMKFGERCMLNLIGHPSWRNVLPFGILHRMKVSWNCVLMKSQNMSHKICLDILHIEQHIFDVLLP